MQCLSKLYQRRMDDFVSIRVYFPRFASSPELDARHKGREIEVYGDGYEILHVMISLSYTLPFFITVTKILYLMSYWTPVWQYLDSFLTVGLTLNFLLSCNIFSIPKIA